MENQRSDPPDRREFVRRLGSGATYRVPVFAALGAAAPQSRAGSSTPEQIARALNSAARSLNEAYRLGARQRFTAADWEVMQPAVDAVRRPILTWPPDWCTIC